MSRLLITRDYVLHERWLNGFYDKNVDVLLSEGVYFTFDDSILGRKVKDKAEIIATVIEGEREMRRRLATFGGWRGYPTSHLGIDIG